MIFTNGIFHSMVSEEDTFFALEEKRGKILRVFRSPEEVPAGAKTVDLGGKHVYPCLIDAHTHLLMTVGQMAIGFCACEITPHGVEPHTLAGVEARIRAYASTRPKNAVIAVNNFIRTAVDERRLPTREELDDWGGGRAVVVYNIDGHSTALSTQMLRLVGIDPEGHTGLLQGEENERTQGRLLDVVGSSIDLVSLARGIGMLHNKCAEYGIGIVGALEGNGDSPKDSTTGLIIRLARHFEVGVRLYLQYTDIERVRPWVRLMKHKRVGGCGDWEMDGASGAHSAAFSLPYSDTGKTAPCYYEQERVNELVRAFDAEGFQIASHAIGDMGIRRITEALEQTEPGTLHRIEHCEFHDDETFELLKRGRYAVMMQPGYAWIDKRYLHTYEQYLPGEIRDRMKFKSLYDAGICVCGSSDSPVQDLDPYLQMLGMTRFYNENESVTPYEAMVTYTRNAARALLEGDEYGTLEVGKTADFFTADRDFFRLDPDEVVSFRPCATYYGGKPVKKKRGTVGELIAMLLKPARKL